VELMVSRCANGVALRKALLGAAGEGGGHGDADHEKANCIAGQDEPGQGSSICEEGERRSVFPEPLWFGQGCDT